jgi:beta-glucosidase
MRKTFPALIAVLFVCLASHLTKAQTLPSVPAQQTTGTPDERADALIKQMTLDEKISLLSGASDGFSTHAIDRLGIGSFHMSDGPQGVRNGPGNPAPRACAFPCGAALAATFDPQLAAAYGKAIGLEDRARGSYYQLGPGVNICRVPVNGRNFEYFGEDPFLASVIAVNWVKNCSAQGAIPTIKHFAGNNQETDRNSVDSRIEERTLNEIYLPAFKKATTEGGNVAVMCSYNRLNGSYASNNDWLLNQTLKNTWGFKGLVMSDWGASHSVTDLSHGLDLEMPNGANLSNAKIKAALADGSLKEADIDAALHRILRSEIAEGWMDNGWEQKKADLPMDSPESAKVALDVARASIVLLKNDHNLLPLDRSRIKTIVVLGPNATAPPVIPDQQPATTRAGRRGGNRGRNNDPGLPLNIGGGGSGAVRPFAERFAESDYLKGITKAAGENVKVIHVPMPAGSASQPALPDLSAVKDADVAIVCVGLNRNVESEGRDRPFELPAVQQDLINAVAAANSHTIVINNSGAAVGMTGWNQSASAILQAWYLGQEGGIAIGDVLFGDVNPSGRLCSTFDKTFEDNPAFADYPGVRETGAAFPIEHYSEGIFYGYRGYDKSGRQPLFPFGFGLSYTTFELSNMKIDRNGTDFSVSLDVKNTGQRTGAQVVQIYVGEQNCPLPRPLRELKGFAKAMLNPGESRRVQIPLPRESFAYWSLEKKDWTIDAGNKFTIEAGDSERDIKLKESINIQ